MMDKEIEDRIFSAANLLYEEGGREAFPKVDAVRKVARANMNDVSTAMKKWRDLQRVQPVQVVLIHVPLAIEEASRALLGTLWQSAQELSNSALKAAQAGWEVERIREAVISKELADAFESNAREVETAQGEITQLQASAATSASDLAQLHGDFDAMQRALADAKAAAEQSAQIVNAQHVGEVAQLHAAIEAERVRRLEEVALSRAELHEQHQKATAERDQLSSELAKVKAEAVAAEQQRAIDHDRLTSVEAELTKQHQNAAAERDQSRLELEKVKAEAAAAEQQRVMAHERLLTAEAERSDSVKEAAAAREDAAGLRGQVEAMQKQTSALLAIIGRWQAPLGEDKTVPDQVGQILAAASVQVDFDPSSAMPEVQT